MDSIPFTNTQQPAQNRVSITFWNQNNGNRKASIIVSADKKAPKAFADRRSSK